MVDDERDVLFEERQIGRSVAEERENYFTGLFDPCDTRYGPKGYLFPREYPKIGREIYKMKVRPDDIFVITFPKCGTTWTQELVWLIKNNFDFEKAKGTPLPARFPSLDLPIFFKPQVLAKITADKDLKGAANELPVDTVRQMASCPSPRFIKTHQPLSLLPPKLLDTCKVVYVARDPRDVAVSFYHYHKLVKCVEDKKDFKTYWNFFIRDLIEYTPFFSHIKEAWEVRNHPNMLFLFYEELSKIVKFDNPHWIRVVNYSLCLEEGFANDELDIVACAHRVAKFFGKEIKKEQIDKLCEHLHIDNFRQNKAVNFEGLRELGFFNNSESFIRKGKVSGWRDYFDEDMSQQADVWMQENLSDTDLCFPQF